jgi:hypothetical protein
MINIMVHFNTLTRYLESLQLKNKYIYTHEMMKQIIIIIERVLKF